MGTESEVVMIELPEVDGDTERQFGRPIAEADAWWRDAERKVLDELEAGQESGRALADTVTHIVWQRAKLHFRKWIPLELQETGWRSPKQGRPAPGQSGTAPREALAPGRDHLTVSGTFQSDRYPTVPAGKVPLSVRDPLAQDLLWEYAQRHRRAGKHGDSEFPRDLEDALRNAGFEAPGQSEVG